MAIQQQVPLQDNASPGLPPVLINAHSFFAFSMRMHHALEKLERRFANPEKPGVPKQRKAWKPLPNKPR